MRVSGSRFRAVGYWMAKDGNQELEWEDSLGYCEQRGLFAIADGVSNAFDSAEWAETLTRSFIRDLTLDGTLHGEFRPWLLQRVNDWWATQPAAAAWWEEDAADDGSAATFLGMRIGPDLVCEHVSVGDCCMFRLRAGKIDVIVAPEAFTNRPAVLSNLPDRVGDLAPSVDTDQAEPGDRYFLTSDALGATLQKLGGKMDWAALATMGLDRFRDMVAELRQHGQIENDDVALLIVEVR